MDNSAAYELIRAEMDAAPLWEPEPEPSRFGALWWDEIDFEMKSDDFVKGLLGNGGMSVTYGESGCGKSFFVSDLALHVALGWQWRGRKVEQGGVIYIAAEGASGMRRRIAAFRQHHRDKLKMSRHVPFVLIPTAVDLLDPKADAEPLADEIKAASERMDVPVRLVVVDTLSRVLAGGNENASDDMGAFVRNVDRIRETTGAHVMIVHHSGKDTSRGARGHSLLRAATDTEIEIVRDTGTSGDKSKLSRATVTKQKDGDTGDEYAFVLRQVTLGHDEDGDPLTSCIVEESDAPETPKRRLTDRDKLTLKCLSNLIVNEGEPLPRTREFPDRDNYLGANMSRFREQFYRIVTAGTSGDTAKKAFQREIEKLQAAGMIVVFGDWVWLPGQAGHTGTSAEMSRWTLGHGQAGHTGHNTSKCPVTRPVSRPDIGDGATP